MKYLLLVHHNEDAFGKMSETARKKILEESVQLTHQLHTKRQYLSASPLHPASTAVIVRVREGKPFVTDGPFMETREQLAGYFLIDAKEKTLCSFTTCRCRVLTSILDVLSNFLINST